MRPLNPNTDTAKFTVEIPMELRLRLNECMRREDRKLNMIVRRALEQYITASEEGRHD